MRTDTVTLGSSRIQAQLTYPNSLAFMFSRQPIIVEAEQDLSGSDKIEVLVEHWESGRTYSEVRTPYQRRVEFDISRILQLLAPDIDGVLRRVSHTSGESISEEYRIIVYYESGSGGKTILKEVYITAMYGTLEPGDIYGAHSQRRLWVNFPQTFNLWVDDNNELAFILDDVYIYPNTAQTRNACYECDLNETLLSKGYLEEFQRQLPGRPQRNIGLTWSYRIERGEEIPEEMRIITLVPDFSKRDEGTYLRWLNRRGEISYYLFKNSQLRVTTAAAETFSRYYEGDPNTPKDGGYNNPLKANLKEGREMVIGAVGVSLDEFEDLCDLATSPVVERLMPRVSEENTAVDIVYDGGHAGTSTKVEVDSEAGESYAIDAGSAAPDKLNDGDYLWQRINVVAGTFNRNIRKTTPNGQDFEIIIELPERNTIKL